MSKGIAAIYARQSRTDDSKADKKKREQHVETTLDTQTAACKRAAQSNGYTCNAESTYAERYTGAEMWDRPVLSEVRRRIKAREFAALYVYSTDRLARDPIHLALILEECDRAHCELVFVSEPIEKSPEGELILYIKGYAAKIERLRIKDRMARGRNAIIAAGKLTCQGTASYGFVFDTANRVRRIDENTAPIVRDIFRWTIEGMSAPLIAERLRNMKIPCPGEYAGKRYSKGQPIWIAGAISRMLNDEAYKGDTYAGKFKVTDKLDKKSGRYFSYHQLKSDWKKLPEGVTPAIVTPETFEAARCAVARNVRRAHSRRNEIRPVLLRGFVFCGACELPMYSMSESTHKPDNPNRQIYRCSSGRHKSDIIKLREGRPICGAKRIIAAGLEATVWSSLVKFFIEPKTVEREVERVLSSVPDDSLKNDMIGAEKQLERARRLRDNHMTKYDEAVADGDDEMSAKWDAKVKEANSDVKALASIIKDLSARLSAYNNSGKTARAFAVQCKKVMGAKDFTFDEKRAALAALGVQVFAHVDKPLRLRLSTGILTEQQDNPVSVEVLV